MSRVHQSLFYTDLPYKGTPASPDSIPGDYYYDIEADATTFRELGKVKWQWWVGRPEKVSDCMVKKHRGYKTRTAAMKTAQMRHREAEPKEANCGNCSSPSCRGNNCS